MDRKHLLWWVIDHLSTHHRSVLDELLHIEGEFGDGATHSVAQAMRDAYERYLPNQRTVEEDVSRAAKTVFRPVPPIKNTAGVKET